jgi:hypothetical protein
MARGPVKNLQAVGTAEESDQTEPRRNHAVWNSARR